MLTLMRWLTYPARWILSALVAMPIAAVIYRYVNPQSMADVMAEAIYSGIRRLSGSGPIAQNVDYGQLIIFFLIAFGACNLLLRSWYHAPLTLALTIPTFEAARHYQIPRDYVAETAILWWSVRSLITPLLAVWLAIILTWRIVIYHGKIRRIGWRRTASTAGIAIIAVRAIAVIWPAGFDPRTSQSPGSVWLVLTLLVWGVLVWLVGLRRSSQQPDRKIIAPKSGLTFESAYRRIRDKRG